MTEGLTCVHHVELGVRDGREEVKRFTTQYGFCLLATRNSLVARQWLLGSHDIRFLITELTEAGLQAAATHGGCSDDPYVHAWLFPAADASCGEAFGTGDELPTDWLGGRIVGQIDLPRDSVFNVALRVKNLDACLARLASLPGPDEFVLLKALRTLSDQWGSVRLATVRSCVGNVVHTLIDDSQYSGVFLPGFCRNPGEPARGDGRNLSDDASSCRDPDGCWSSGTSEESADESRDLRAVDHVTFCVERGASAGVIDWYQRCFGMKRFIINRDENEEEGFVIKTDNVGMRLKAFEYWKCAETGISLPEKGVGSVKFVIAEALPHQVGINQVELFLEKHGGPGIQHVGLHTNDIIGSISRLQGNGVVFNETPYTYYTEIGRLKEMVAMGMDVTQLKKNGILVDMEADEEYKGKPDNNSTEETLPQQNGVRYLMQKFTRPLFEADTFFLEVIQRVGATGFGSGNITALWRSVQAYFKEKELEQSQAQKV